MMFGALVDYVEKLGREYWQVCPAMSAEVSKRSGGRLDVLYRSGCLQIERASYGPQQVVPMHRHPHVTTYEFTLAGNGELWLGKRRFVIDSRTAPWRGMLIPRNYPHGGMGYDQGGSFLSVQYWDIEPVRSITQDWEYV